MIITANNINIQKTSNIKVTFKSFLENKQPTSNSLKMFLMNYYIFIHNELEKNIIKIRKIKHLLLDLNTISNTFEQNSIDFALNLHHKIFTAIIQQKNKEIILMQKKINLLQEQIKENFYLIMHHKKTTFDNILTITPTIKDLIQEIIADYLKINSELVPNVNYFIKQQNGILILENIITCFFRDVPISIQENNFINLLKKYNTIHSNVFQAEHLQDVDLLIAFSKALYYLILASKASPQVYYIYVFSRENKEKIPHEKTVKKILKHFSYELYLFLRIII